MAYASATLSVCVLGMVTWTLHDSNHAARRHAEQQAGNIALTLERDVGQTVELFDLSLRSAIRGMGRPGLATLDPDVRQSVLFGGALAEGSAAVFVADALGRVIFNSTGPHAANFNIADRDYFLAQRANPNLGLSITKPLKSRYNGAWNVPLARRVNNPDGSFAGLAFGGIGQNYFQSMFSRLDIGDQGSIVLLSTNGVLLARRPFVEQDVGRDLSGVELFRRLAQSPAGFFEGSARVDGVRRLYSYRKVGDLPLVISVGLSTREVYEEWVQKSAITGASFLTLSALGIGLAWFLRRELRRRTQSEAAALATSEALRKSEEFLDRTGRVAGVGGWERDLVTGEVSWSAETCRLLGVAPDHKPKLEEVANFYTPEARRVVLPAMARAASGGEGWDLEVSMIRVDGRQIWARSVGAVEFAAGKPIRLVGAMQDTTDQRAARLRLKEALERVTLAADGGRVGIWDWDVGTDQIIWDPWMYRLYGLEPGDGLASYELWTRHLHPDDRAGAEMAVREGAGGGEPFDTEFRIIWNDGSVHHIRAAARVTRDSTGRALRMLGTNWDVTESRELAAELVRRADLLAEAAERETALFRNSPDLLTVVRVEGDAGQAEFVYEAFSPALEATTGMRPGDLLGRSPETCLPPEMSVVVTSRYRRCLEGDGTIAYRDTYALPVGTRDFEGSITPVLNPATGRVVRLVGAMRDVTERNRMEQTLRHAQKMEAVGRLSAGVAHDFNNILQSVVGGLELVLEEVDQGSPAHQFANVAINSAMRGASLTHHLLSYARKQTLRPQAVEVAEFLADLGTLLARTLGPQTTILVRVEGIPCVLADPGQLQTALLNLAINASHAMPQGGVLSLDARTEADAGRGWVLLAVTDTGVGMDEATLAQAADPFFSTKGLDGSGLGLSMVQGFAEQSGGGFRISSAPGEGTTVELRLPAAAPDQHPGPPERLEARPASGRVLLVDDAPDVLATTGAFLERAGFVVVRADSGDQARDMLAAGERFDALVSDYAMPGLSGADLIVEAQALQPGLRALLITGYASAGYAGTLPEGTPVLHKPFQRDDLVAALHHVLERGRDTSSGGSPIDGTGLSHGSAAVSPTRGDT